MRALLKLAAAVVFVVVAVGFFMAYPAGAGNNADASHDASMPHGRARIISLSPSVTETLFALGLDSSVVGVTRYCVYPPEACTRAKVGGYITPSYEAIVALEPDVVVLLPEHGEVIKNISLLGIKTIVVNNKTVEDILLSIRELGAAFGVQERAQELERGLRERIEAVRKRTSGLSRPRVAISIARGMGTMGIKTMYLAGRNGYFDELLDIAGGMNAYRDGKIKFPKVSKEGLVFMAPDVIVDLVPALEKKGWKVKDVLEEWNALHGVKAVDDGRVYVLGSDYVTIPGPRFILLLEDIAGVIHPAATGTKQAGRR